MNQACCMIINPNKIPHTKNYLKRKIRKEVRRVFEEGCTHFIADFEDSTSIIFAHEVNRLKKFNKITLEAMLRNNKKILFGPRKYRKAIATANFITVCSKEENLISQECLKKLIFSCCSYFISIC